MIDKITHYKTIYIKKGKIREYRTYDQSGKRVEVKL